MSNEEVFAQLSLNEKQIAEFLKKPKLIVAISSVVDEAKSEAIDKPTGALMLSLAQASAKDDKLPAASRAYIAKSIADQKLRSNLQVEGEHQG